MAMKIPPTEPHGPDRSLVGASNCDNGQPNLVVDKTVTHRKVNRLKGSGRKAGNHFKAASHTTQPDGTIFLPPRFESLLFMGPNVFIREENATPGVDSSIATITVGDSPREKQTDLASNPKWKKTSEPVRYSTSNRKHRRNKSGTRETKEILDRKRPQPNTRWTFSSSLDK